MMRFKNLILIGTSHISKDSIREVERTIEEEKPDVIALELDFRRFHALMNPQKIRIRDIRAIGLKGWILNLVGSFVESKMGKIVGVKPGTEMKTAVLLAAENKIRIALIDRDITITIKRLTKNVTTKEKFRFLGDILKSAILKKEPEITFDLSKVPEKEIIDKLLLQVKKRYPTVYEVLVRERDEHMAKALNKLLDTDENKKIVAIVGAGHEESIIKNMMKVRQSNSLQKKKSKS